jgi:hypothetical protein
MPTTMNALCGEAATIAGSPAMPLGPSTASSTTTTAGDTFSSNRARSSALAVAASGSTPGSDWSRLQRAIRMASWRAAMKTETGTSAMCVWCAAIWTKHRRRRQAAHPWLRPN